jgi:hypothetical protein
MNDTASSPSTSSSPASLRDLLAQVAAGELDPGEAARLLDADPSAPTLDRRDDVRAEAPVSALAIHAGGVKLTVVADPTVDTAVADGPHALRREGSVLVLDAPSEDGFRTTPPPRFLGWVPTVWTGGRGQKVLVRVNPALPLTVEATACSVDISGLRAPLTLGGSASSIKVGDHTGALHGSLAMGSLEVVAVVDAPSDLACELGSLDLRLLPGSDVTVAATSDLGEVKLPGAHGAEKASARQSYVVGAGTHPFTVAVRLGSASVAGA